MIANIVGFFSHKNCKKQLNELMQLGLEDSKKIQSLNSQIIILMNQIQELKAIHDYAALDLEKKIADLEKQLALESSKKPKKENV